MKKHYVEVEFNEDLFSKLFIVGGFLSMSGSILYNVLYEKFDSLAMVGVLSICILGSLIFSLLVTHIFSPRVVYIK